MTRRFVEDNDRWHLYRPCALIFDYFQASKFRAAEITRPEPTAGQVLVRITASGLNPIDGKIRTGQAPRGKPVVPAVLGTDLAGVVEAVKNA